MTEQDLSGLQGAISQHKDQVARANATRLAKRQKQANKLEQLKDKQRRNYEQFATLQLRETLVEGTKLIQEEFPGAYAWVLSPTVILGEETPSPVMGAVTPFRDPGWRRDGWWSKNYPESMRIEIRPTTDASKVEAALWYMMPNYSDYNSRWFKVYKAFENYPKDDTSFLDDLLRMSYEEATKLHKTPLGEEASRTIYADSIRAARGEPPGEYILLNEGKASRPIFMVGRKEILSNTKSRK